jgi:glycosyltransferase involved in cell wall biosynthesis
VVPNLTKFNIVIPTYNCQDWIIDCVKSVYAQQHTNYNCVIVNDASDDDTKNILSSIQFLKDDERFHVINRENNGGPLSSHIHGWRHLDTDSDENSVLVIVDGDDRLFSPLSLTIVDQAYQQTNCLMTYGNHIHYPTGKSSNCETIPRDVCQNNDFRNYKFVTSHLRTF